MRTTSSPFPVKSPLRTLISVSSFLPLPREAPWTSVAKKHTDAKTRGSKAAYHSKMVGIQDEQVNGKYVREGAYTESLKEILAFVYIKD